MKKTISFFLGLTFFLTTGTPIYAHAFGQSYNLPLPSWLYVYGGGATIIISFLLIGLFTNKSNKHSKYPTKQLTNIRIITVLTSVPAIRIYRIVSVGLLCLMILASFLGIQDTSSNFATVFFWIIFLLGALYSTAILGNYWQRVTPLRLLAQAFTKNRDIRQYPKNLAYLPAFVFFFMVIALEFLSADIGITPDIFGLLVIGYITFTIIGATMYGIDQWFFHNEVFSVLFRLLSTLSIFEKRNNKLYLRPPFVGLFTEVVDHWSLLLFILFMLSSTAFDGFRNTYSWVKLDLIAAHAYNFLGTQGFVFFELLFLLLSPFIFGTFYLVAIRLIKTLVRTKYSIMQLALAFGPSLIPIALAYNVAHYYTLLLVQGQTIIPLAADPFAQGWNLFNGRAYVPNIGIVGANFIWHSQVSIIVIGHIVAVFVAHVKAQELFGSSKKALISQVPMLIVMVFYTIFGLWLLSQPLVVGA